MIVLSRRQQMRVVARVRKPWWMSSPTSQRTRSRRNQWSSSRRRCRRCRRDAVQQPHTGSVRTRAARRPSLAASPRPVPTSRICCLTSSGGRIEPGRVFDRTISLDEVPDGYCAMADRTALKGPHPPLDGGTTCEVMLRRGKDPRSILRDARHLG